MFSLDRLIAALPELASGAATTLALTLCAALVSWAGGVAVAALQLAPVAAARWAGRLYVSFMRGTPALVQLFIVFFALPMLGIKVPPFVAAALTLGLNSAAYVGEILRAGLKAIPAGQIEAAQAIGMARLDIWHRVRLPQAVSLSLAPLANELTLLLKTTPLASVVAVTDLTFAGQIVVARTFQPVEVLAAVAVAYILAGQILLQTARWLERRGAGRMA